MRNDSNHWLERLLERYMYHEPAKFDFHRWSLEHPEESRLLKHGFEASGRSSETGICYVMRCIMKSNITKYSAAAIVALTIALVLLNPFGWPKHSGVLLAAVQEKIADTDTMVIRGQKIISPACDPNLSFKLDVVKYMSKLYGHTEEGYIGGRQAYRLTVNLPEQRAIIVCPMLRKYLAFPATEEQIKIVEKLSPVGVIDLLLQAGYTELGTADINGVEVEGFEFYDAKVVQDILPKFLLDIKQGRGVIWVGTKELLPIKIEGDIVIGPSVLTFFTECRVHETCVLEDYNVELAPELFSTSVPEGFTEIKLTDFIPVKAGLVGAGLVAVPIGLVVGRKLRRRKSVRPAGPA